jgi:alcohol dehydrogenase
MSEGLHSEVGAMSDTLAFDWQPRTRLVFGAGEVARVGDLARELGGRRVLLVTDAGIVAAGHAERVHDALTGAGLIVAVYDKVIENPTTGCVDACRGVARAEQVDVIVGLGGGSSMDTAKGCNFLLTNGGRMQD